MNCEHVCQISSFGAHVVLALNAVAFRLQFASKMGLDQPMSVYMYTLCFAMMVQCMSTICKDAYTFRFEHRLYMDANYIVPMLEFEHHLMFALQSRLMHYWSILLS